MSRVAWNEYMDAFTFISSQFWVFTRNELMGCSEAFQANANGVNHTPNVTSHVGTPMNILGENMTRDGKIKKCRKNSQN